MADKTRPSPAENHGEQSAEARTVMLGYKLDHNAPTGTQGWWRATN
ncbi:MAG: hypothetical protein LBV68_09145 [Spirochaetaceae bacterium]|nr:hypothetical protein [Spirochaetaceae bacterium]